MALFVWNSLFACRKNRSAVCLDHYHKAMRFVVVQRNEVYLYFYKLKFKIMANTIKQLNACTSSLEKEGDDYVCKLIKLIVNSHWVNTTPWVNATPWVEYNSLG